MSNIALNKLLIRLGKLYPKYIDLSLKRLEILLKKLNNPHLKLPPTIHIAGTNGKGSTLSFIKHILIENDYKIHCYISPHLESIRERFIIANKTISNKKLYETLKYIELINNKNPITFFEITTAAAFYLFCNKNADFLILETGLGGRCDATNIIKKSMIDIITPISFDHQEYLGKTLKKITNEKLGIIKKNSSVIISKQNKDIMEYIKIKLKKMNNNKLFYGKDWEVFKIKKNKFILSLKNKKQIINKPTLIGNHQIENASLAIASIYEIKNADKIKQEKRKNIIIDSQSEIRISLKLVTLDNAIDLPLKIEDVEPYINIKNNTKSIYDFLQEQGFRAIQQRIENNSFINNENLNSPSEASKNQQEISNYITIDKISELNNVIEEIKKIGFFSIDTETNSLDIEKAELVGISICFDEKNAFYIPINHKNPDTNKVLKNQIPEIEVIKLINTICSDLSILKIGQNLKYDMRILKKYDVTFNSIDDTMLLSYVLDNGLIRHGMDDLAYRHLNHTTIKFKDLVGSGKKQITFDYVPIDQATKYAAEDALITLKLYNHLKPRVVNEKTTNVYEKIDKPLLNVLSSMEEIGIKVNEEYLKKLSDQFNKEAKNIEKQIYKITGKEFNIGSPKQLGEIMFIEMKIQGGKKTKTGTYSTDSGILEDLSLQGHEIAKFVLEWREVSKLRSTYTDALQVQIDPKTKRVHTSYATATTLTGRLSSNNPNLQNIPIRTDKGKQIRHAFVAEKKYKLVSFDYSQIELRLAAEISKDENFIAAFINGEDIHSSTAKEIFNLKGNEPTSEHRRKAKAINFGILYGISPYGLAKQLSVTNSEAKNYIENYFKRFPKIKDYMDFQINHAKTNNFVKTMFGRKCNIKGINDKNFAVRGFAERQSINAPIQGTASDIIKLAMIEIHKYILSQKIKAKMLLQVHDELIFEISEQDIKESSIIIKQIMENSHLRYKDFTVPLTVDYGIGNTWGESH